MNADECARDSSVRRVRRARTDGMSVGDAILRSYRASARRSARRVARARTMRATNVPSIVSFVARVACLFVAASASGSSAGVARARRGTMEISHRSPRGSRDLNSTFPRSRFVCRAGIDVDLARWRATTRRWERCRATRRRRGARVGTRWKMNCERRCRTCDSSAS